jgi:hypothetical protein
MRTVGLIKPCRHISIDFSFRPQHILMDGTVGWYHDVNTVSYSGVHGRTQCTEADDSTCTNFSCASETPRPSQYRSSWRDAAGSSAAVPITEHAQWDATSRIFSQRDIGVSAAAADRAEATHAASDPANLTRATGKTPAPLLSTVHEVTVAEWLRATRYVPHASHTHKQVLLVRCAHFSCSSGRKQRLLPHAQ